MPKQSIMLRIIFVFIPVIFFQTLLICQNSSAQTVLLRKEQSYYGKIHSEGWGFGFRTGKHLTIENKFMYDFSFYTMKSPKEVRLISNLFYTNAKSYYYGKMNYFFILQSSIGRKKIRNEKPYWGGIEVRSFYFIGPAIGFAKPVYLYVFDYSKPFVNPSIEKYDPEKHFYENIYGRGPFFKGFNEIKLHPGINFKAGLNFEFSTADENIRSLETGVMVNAFLRPVEIMSFNKKDYFFISLYLSYHFGKRFN